MKDCQNNRKLKDLFPLFGSFAKSISAISDSFCLITSHLVLYHFRLEVKMRHTGLFPDWRVTLILLNITIIEYKISQLLNPIRSVCFLPDSMNTPKTSHAYAVWEMRWNFDFAAIFDCLPLHKHNYASATGDTFLLLLFFYLWPLNQNGN